VELRGTALLKVPRKAQSRHERHKAGTKGTKFFSFRIGKILISIEKKAPADPADLALK